MKELSKRVRLGDGNNAIEVEVENDASEKPAWLSAFIGEKKIVDGATPEQLRRLVDLLPYAAVCADHGAWTYSKETPICPGCAAENARRAEDDGQ